MKKTLIPLIVLALFVLSVCSVSAWTDFGGRKEPYPVGVYVQIGDIQVQGAEIEACNVRTSYCEKRLTNKVGYEQFELGNFKVLDSYVRPWDFGDTIKVTACKNNPKCTQEFRIGSSGFEYMASLRFIITDEVTKIVEKENIIEKQVIVEKEVAGKKTTVTILDEEVEATTWDNFVKYLPWGAAFLAMCFAVYAFSKTKAKKMFKTAKDKFKAGEYKTKER